MILDEHILKTLNMKGSVYAKPCQTQVESWYKKLCLVHKTFEEWVKVQSNLLNLLPIFSVKDIVSQMPEEAKAFTRIEGMYKKYIQVHIFENISCWLT